MNEESCSSCSRPTCTKELRNYGGRCEDCAAAVYQAVDASQIGQMLKERAENDSECGGGRWAAGQAEGNTKIRS